MKERKVALFKGLRDPQIQGYATCAADIKKHIEACENKKLIQYHRDGKTWAKPKMGGIILNRHMEGAEELRKDNNFYPTAVGDFFMFDKDGLEKSTPFNGILSPEELCKKLVETLDEQVPGFADCCVFEKSCSGSLHGAVPCFSGNPKQDLLFYEKVLGVEVDKSVLNPSRCYIVTHHILHGSYDCLFREVPQEVIEGLRSLSLSLSQGEGTSGCAVEEVQKVEESVVKEDVNASGDIELYREIITELLEGQLPVQGTRNQTLYRHTVELMSLGLTDYEQLCDVFESFDWYGLSSSEGKACIRSALKKEAPERSVEMREAVTAVLESLPATFALSNEHVVHGKSEHTVQSPACVCDAATETESASEGTVDAMVGFSPWQKHAPAMPEYKNLPPHIRALLKPIKKKSLWAHCISMSEPTLASLVKGTTFKDLHSDTWNLYSGLMCCGVAPTSSGKSSSWKCINAICEASGLFEIDLMARKELDDWRSEERKRSSSTTGSTRPRNYSQILGSSATQSAIVQRHSDLEEGRSLLMNTSEISCLSQLSGGTKDGKQLFVQNFDYDWFRTERSSAAADSSAIRLAMNISTCCPPSVCREFFTGEWLTGLIPRWNFCTIIRDYDEDPSAPLYGDFTGYADSLKPFLARLDSVADQQLDIASIRTLAQELTDKMLDYACATGSGALETLVRRSAVRFLRSAYLHYVLNGSKLTQNLREFLMWRWYYLVFGSMYCVGELIEKEHAKDEAAISGKKQNGPVNLLTYLPEDFDIAKLRALRVERKFADNSDTTLKNQLRTWRNRKLISEVSPGVYRKCKK
ncbi:MAG: hypothetical protein IKV15_03130 [Bacteroidaceae bacterium]|nr:hypothetical protein [Bacteroidaceae bacterium]